MKIMMFVLTLLLGGVCFSGVQAAKFAHEQSNLVNEVQSLKKTRDQINAEWTQLLLEQKMLADDSVIDHAVRNGLDMHLPQSTQVVYLD
ncbi:MAG: cell division protein FtsL [Cardiobacteriaceae bacterium]|nr:cell division protein FtsL [Cardiobacteriaceae bacterium]